jgi:hypothetical protein
VAVPLEKGFEVDEKRAEVLLTWMGVIDMYTLGRALNDLTQEELDWEPHPGAYGVRRRELCTTPNPSGAPDGDWVSDGDWEIGAAADRGEAVEPMTTIGWLLNHFGAAPGLVADSEIVGGPTALEPDTYFRMWGYTNIPDVETAVARFKEGWSALNGKLRAASDELLERKHEHHPWGRGVDAIAAMLNEVSHHGTQICMLRDLYAHDSSRAAT